MAEPRILFWDIENSQNLAAVFQLKHNDYINAENIFQERFIICAAWSWMGKSKVHAVSLLDNHSRFLKNPHDDTFVVKRLHDVLSEADVIIAHNGDEFDTKMVRGRMLQHQLPPLPPILSIDTLKTARKQFLLNANNLDYLGNYLGVGRKKPTKPGLWLKVLRGDEQAIRDMVKYNKGDVQLLKRVFDKLRPYIPDHVNRQLFAGNKGLSCPRCGSANVQSRGIHRALTQTYQRYRCNVCLGWFRWKRADIGTATTTRVL